MYVFKEILGQLNIRDVTTAFDGEEALRKFEEATQRRCGCIPFKTIVLDY